MAVRAALGAGRMRIIRQLLSETAVLGLLGGVAGIAIAYWGVQAISSILPSTASPFVAPTLPELNTIRVDNFVLGFALLLSAVSGKFCVWISASRSSVRRIQICKRVSAKAKDAPARAAAPATRAQRFSLRRNCTGDGAAGFCRTAFA